LLERDDVSLEADVVEEQQDDGEEEQDVESSKLHEVS
jgi:hypothetical protein